ncbi:MAG: hypothetical protein H6705_07775 [Myxococcales bacterium]|nr:hypothetical protein [Myxococcales bacterium]
MTRPRRWMPIFIGWATLAGLAGLAGGCDEPVTCEHDGRRFAEGEHVDDEARRLRCTCTAGGVVCDDLPGGPMVLDAALDGSAVDAMPDSKPDAIDAIDARPDATHAIDAAADATAPMPDAAPPACPPWDEIVDGSQCFRLAGAVCHRGAPFDCCGRPYPGERTCTCAANTWRCVDEVAACEGDPAIGACGARTRICDRWRAARLLTDPIEVWTGDFDRCIADDMSDRWRDDTLEVINTVRLIAGVPPVTRAPALDLLAQHCALAVFWHGTEDHHLDPDTPCYSPLTAEGVLESLINLQPAIASVPTYMIDPDVPSLVHRLYLLAPQLGPVGIGSTDRSSCVHVFDDRGDPDEPAFVAWPAPGAFPVDAAFTGFGGWTVQSNVVNLTRAVVRVSVDGVALPVEARALAAPGAAGWAIAFVPGDGQLEAGRRYRVEVDGGLRRGEPVAFDYTVEAVDCDAP